MCNSVMTALRTGRSRVCGLRWNFEGFQQSNITHFKRGSAAALLLSTKPPIMLGCFSVLFFLHGSSTAITLEKLTSQECGLGSWHGSVPTQHNPPPFPASHHCCLLLHFCFTPFSTNANNSFRQVKVVGDETERSQQTGSPQNTTHKATDTVLCVVLQH